MRPSHPSFKPDPRLFTSYYAAAPLRDIAVGAGSSLVVCALLLPLREYLTLANVALGLVMVVAIVAVRSTRRAALFAALAAALGFAYVFVPPQFSLLITEVQYVLTALFMMAAALVIGELAADLRQRADDAQRREALARLLFETAEKLTGAPSQTQAVEITRRALGETLGLDLDLYDDADEQSVITSGLDADLVRKAIDSPDPLPAGNRLLLHLPTPAGHHIVLAVGPLRDCDMADPEVRQLLATLASLLNIAIERIHYVDVAQQAQRYAENERLRNSLLTALSHDVRTPLAALVTTADALSLSSPPLAGIQHELAKAIRDQGLRLSGIVGKLLDMARLQSGAIRLQRRRQALEPVVRGAMATLGRALDRVQVKLAMPEQLPEFAFDAVLIERVLQNLLENAAKHSAEGGVIEVSAACSGDSIIIAVSDGGSGVDPEMRERLFEKFAHGRGSSAGVGLGLAICRTIVEFHDGRIAYEASPAGGSRFVVILPADAADSA